jgi:hypothetical protein
MKSLACSRVAKVLQRSRKPLVNALEFCQDRQNIARDKAAVDNCAERSMHRVSHTSKQTVDNKTKNMAFFLNRSSEVKKEDSCALNLVDLDVDLEDFDLEDIDYLRPIDDVKHAVRPPNEPMARETPPSTRSWLAQRSLLSCHQDGQFWAGVGCKR